MKLNPIHTSRNRVSELKKLMHFFCNHACMMTYDVFTYLLPDHQGDVVKKR